MKEDYLTLHDSGGKLITNATRANNRLYKVLMETVDTRCLQSMVQPDSTMWHARLGHIGVDSM